MKMMRKFVCVLCACVLAMLTVPVIAPDVPVDIMVEAATKVKINKKSAYILKGDTMQLFVTGTSKKAKWSTSNKKIATVSSRGKVKGIKKGIATITATVGKKRYSCKVTVETPSINKTKVSLNKGTSTTLKVKGTKQKVLWSSSNKAVATVSNKGVVKGRKNGKATIIAKVGNKKLSCKVTVKTSYVEVEHISLNYSGITMTVGETYALKVDIYPSNATNKKVNWSSSDNRVVSVNSNGKITANGVGEANICVEVDGEEDYCYVVVEKGENPPQNPDNPSQDLEIKYISDEQVERVSKDKLYRVFFSLILKDASTRVSSSGVANIKIVNDKSEEVYYKKIPFTEKNFGYWTNKLLGRKYYCCIEIPDADIKGGKVSTGNLSLEVKLSNGKSFPKGTYSIYGLPLQTIEVEEVRLDKTTLELCEGNKYALTATVLPENAKDKTVVWNTSDANVATVKDGVVNAVAPGTAIITVSSNNGMYASCKVEVVDITEYIKYNMNYLKNYILENGEINSKGNRFISMDFRENNTSISVGITYEPIDNRFQFAYSSEDAISKSAISMYLDFDNDGFVTPQYVVAYKDISLGFIATTTLEMKDYNINKTVHFDLVKATGLTESGIQKLSNSELKAAFSGWGILLIDYPEMLLSDIGFTSF